MRAHCSSVISTAGTSSKLPATLTSASSGPSLALAAATAWRSSLEPAHRSIALLEVRHVLGAHDLVLAKVLDHLRQHQLVGLTGDVNPVLVGLRALARHRLQPKELAKPVGYAVVMVDAIEEPRHP